MKKIIYSILLVFLFVLSVIFGANDLAKAGESPFTLGDGSELNPYQIENCEQFQAIDTPVELCEGEVCQTTYPYMSSTTHYILANDIDCSATSISDPLDPNYNASLYNDGTGFK